MRSQAEGLEVPAAPSGYLRPGAELLAGLAAYLSGQLSKDPVTGAQMAASFRQGVQEGQQRLFSQKQLTREQKRQQMLLQSERLGSEAERKELQHERDFAQKSKDYDEEQAMPDGVRPVHSSEMLQLQGGAKKDAFLRQRTAYGQAMQPFYKLWGRADIPGTVQKTIQLAEYANAQVARTRTDRSLVAYEGARKALSESIRSLQGYLDLLRFERGALEEYARELRSAGRGKEAAQWLEVLDRNEAQAIYAQQYIETQRQRMGLVEAALPDTRKRADELKNEKAILAEVDRYKRAVKGMLGLDLG